ncbi:uncharacterized protein [Henckelia pumila]|uniref:uncharacterized protein n=1 Tax=Henckelia pumila TaxID=405737 RepID=UPI003C6DD375
MDDNEGTGHFVVYTDSSKSGLGAVLMQDDKVIAYASRQLKEADALSRKFATLNQMTVQQELIIDFERMSLEVFEQMEVCTLAALTVVTSLLERIRAGQDSDEQLTLWRNRDEAKGGTLYTFKDGIVHHRGRMWVPAVDSLRVEVITEAHTVPYSIHPGICRAVHSRNCQISWSTSEVSDRDPKFTSNFWESLHRGLGTKIAFSTDFHSQTDGQSERVIQILEDMLKACMINFGGNWESKLPLVEFTYNNSYQATIGMTPYEALYGRSCRTPLHGDEVGERAVLGPDIVT